MHLFRHFFPPPYFISTSLNENTFGRMEIRARRCPKQGCCKAYSTSTFTSSKRIGVLENGVPQMEHLPCPLRVVSSTVN